MRLVVFGIGRYYYEHKEELESLLDQDEIVAFMDNATQKDDMFDGHILISPDQITRIDYHIILIMSIEHVVSMKEQLLKIGVHEENIFFFDRYFSERQHGKVDSYITSSPMKNQKRILIITEKLGYHGGAMVAVYAAKALSIRGYYACIVSKNIDNEFLREITSYGINIRIIPSLPYLDERELTQMKIYDAVIVNTFPMILVAKMLSSYKSIFWWIHESRIYADVYKNTRNLFQECDCVKWMGNVKIYAVSHIAKKNFEVYYPNTVNGIQTFGIPDGITKSDPYLLKQGMVFSLIGNLHPIKGQKIFLEAIKRMKEVGKENLDFWIIGEIGDGDYARNIKKTSENYPNVKLLGNLTRNELKKAFLNIDVVVCASLEESMSIAIVEGMMYGKICITSDATGIAEYICDGENGYVFKSGDVDALAQKMSYVHLNKEKMKDICINARKTYEKNFKLDFFGRQLENKLMN